MTNYRKCLSYAPLDIIRKHQTIEVRYLLENMLHTLKEILSPTFYNISYTFMFLMLIHDILKFQNGTQETALTFYQHHAIWAIWAIWAIFIIFLPIFACNKIVIRGTWNVTASSEQITPKNLLVMSDQLESRTNLNFYI